MVCAEEVLDVGGTTAELVTIFTAFRPFYQSVGIRDESSMMAACASIQIDSRSTVKR
jgi:hypothetical protein